MGCGGNQKQTQNEDTADNRKVSHNVNKEYQTNTIHVSAPNENIKRQQSNKENVKPINAPHPKEQQSNCAQSTQGTESIVHREDPPAEREQQLNESDDSIEKYVAYEYVQQLGQSAYKEAMYIYTCV